MKNKNVWYVVFASVSAMSFAYFLIDFIKQTSNGSGSNDWSLAGVKMLITLGALVVILAAWFIHSKDL